MALKVTALRIAIANVLALTAFTAAAQDAAPADQGQQTTELDRIEVTGSRILRTDSETASPVQVLKREEIDRSGKATIGEFLQTLTVDGAGSVPKSFGNGFASGAAGVSLRGLGAGSTLVLVNGRRIAPYGMADDGQKVFTDLSIIPTEAVERVEVLKDGASSSYGSDAIAGVVNIILRRDFTGAVAKASYGQSGEGDGGESKASFTWGAGDLAQNGVNFFFSAEAGKSNEIFVRDRSDRDWIGTGDRRPWGYDFPDFAGVTGRIPPTGAAQNSPTGAMEGPNGWINLDTTGQACAQLSRVTNQTGANGGCLWETGQFLSLQPKQEYVNFFSRGTFAMGDNAELYTEFGYGKKQSSFHNAPSAVSGTWASPDGGAVNSTSGPDATIIGANHPDNPLGVDGRLRYTAFDLGPRQTSVDNQFFRFLVGMKGLVGDWDYDVGYLHSETELASERNGMLQFDRVREVLTDGDNSPVGWWRLGANAGQNSQALYDYISPTVGAKAGTKLDALDVKFSRSFGELAGGPMGLAVGAEWRRERAFLTPVNGTERSNIIGLGYSAYDGEQTVTAAYAEFLAPVLESLEITAAARMDSYRDGETSVTPKLGVKWKPADWIAVRGTYAEGFRAPNPAETAGASVGFATADDPVRCAVAGATNCTVNVAFINRPNADLSPEKSKSSTLGLVLQPTDSTTLTLDAWQIERKNEITTQSLDQALASGNFIRSDDDLPGVPNSGTLLGVYTNYINASSTMVRGIDLDVRQTFGLGNAGRLALDLQWSRINKFERDYGDGTVVDWAGTHGDCNVTNCIGTPKDRINFGATWDMDKFSLSSVVNYRGKIDNVYEKGSECAANFADGSEAPNGCQIDAFYTVDLSGTWNATDALQVFGSVQNVTDRVAPLDPITYGAVNYNPLDFSGAMGRYFTLGVKYSFN